MAKNKSKKQHPWKSLDELVKYFDTHDMGECLKHMPEVQKRDKKWAAVAKRRLAELRSGRVKAIPADKVFCKARDLRKAAKALRRDYATNPELTAFTKAS